MGVDFKDGAFVAGIDTDKDGKDSVGVKLNLQEAFQEGMSALGKGEEKEVEVEVKKLRLKFKDGKVKAVVDTDQDGESLLDVEVDMAESFDEVSQKVWG